MNEGELIWMVLGVLGLVAGLLVSWQKLRHRDPPLERDLATMARQADLEKLRQEMPHLATREELGETERRLASQIQHMGEHLDGKRSASVGNLHGQLKEQSMKLASLETKAESQGGILTSMDSKIDQLIRREIRRAEGVSTE